MGANEDNSSLETQAVEAELTLLEVEPGVAVLFGKAAPEGWDVEPFGLGDSSDREIVDALSDAVGAANFVAQGLGGLVSAQGLVRLAPEPIQNLRTMQTIAKDGYYLGTLTQGGKFAASVRWAPAAGAQAATVLDKMGPSLALLAISAQLTAISSKVDENIELTRDVLKALREDHWNRLGGLCDTIAGAIDEARTVGTVTSRTFERVKHLEDSLREERRTFAGYLNKHLKKLDVDYIGRRDYLRDNAEIIIADAQGFIMAETAYYRYQMLRAAEIAADNDRTAGDDELMRLLARKVPVERRESMNRVTRALEQLNAHCHLADKLSGRRWSLRDLRSRRSSSINQTVSAMIEYVDRLRGAVYERPTELRPSITVVKDDAPTRALDILRWVLAPEEPLLALAEVSQSGLAKAIPGSDVVSGGAPGRLMGTASYLGITPTRFFLTSQSALTGDGNIERSVPLSEVRYVRLRTGKKGASLDIITRDKDISVSFEDWATEGAHDDEVRRVADLLMAAANLPEEEQRSVPELQQITTRSQLVEVTAGERLLALATE
ncbi:hypothetical protein E4J66_10570 [Actinomyces viscosus]|uniref:Uncharacterized protein n=1 Tax=Actinomyces viscosus TaxID=1656 RepID=A0A448PNJ3_ACTVI|nr:hypothetical protein [Actinomyces viscosus]TFH51826.1 hypothetical protein E4J66_10570 [Actinomyces viscosus]VEI17955.1 Uncharacterised protein [Actinomyces viscosus]